MLLPTAFHRFPDLLPTAFCFPCFPPLLRGGSRKQAGKWRIRWVEIGAALVVANLTVGDSIGLLPKGAVPVAWPGSGRGGWGCQPARSLKAQPQPTPLAGFFCAFRILSGQACCICEAGRSDLLSTVRNTILEQCITRYRSRLSRVGQRFFEIGHNICRALCDAVPSVCDPGQLAWRHCSTAPGYPPLAPRAGAGTSGGRWHPRTGAGPQAAGGTSSRRWHLRRPQALGRALAP
jgi:hypothetical protein